MPLADLYIGFARQDEPVTRNARRRQIFSVAAAGEIITAVRAQNTPGLRSAYDKIRIRRSIEYPVTGVAVAFGATATSSPICASPSPAPIRGRCGFRAPPRSAAVRSTQRVFAGLDALVRDQIMAMKTTFTPGHYRRRVAGVLARRLIAKTCSARIGKCKQSRGCSIGACIRSLLAHSSSSSLKR